MSYRETRIPARLMRYLSQNRYAGLPAILFDRYLWLYAELEKAQHQLVYGPYDPSVRFYENWAGQAEVRGIACTARNGNQLRVFIDAIDSSGLVDFIHQLEQESPGTNVSVTVPEAHLSEFLVKFLGWDCTPGSIKFYADEDVQVGPYTAREMFAPDETYLEPIIPRRWNSYQLMLSLGYRFFGLFSPAGPLLSMCGLVQLTAFRSEIIGVETFALADRRRGYARSVCALALNEGLSRTQVISWSTNLNNQPSCATARSLGFRPMFGLYTLTGSWE